ncbi:13431_t:CDS:10 [Ambispora leptoticha]|uniref:13431_t:CDS:1 n=1 Tax=Ambispora leptoticha TaxID=144679 RepID=A0A9N9D3B0_9GLOM|nr:13431_t:CDS:10 [Ambispora leptoticha]
MRVKLIFDFPSLTRRCWYEICQPEFAQQDELIKDLVVRILHDFELESVCPNGVILSLEGFELLPNGTTLGLIRENDTICVKPGNLELNKDKHLKYNRISTPKPRRKQVNLNSKKKTSSSSSESSESENGEKKRKDTYQIGKKRKRDASSLPSSTESSSSASSDTDNDLTSSPLAKSGNKNLKLNGKLNKKNKTVIEKQKSNEILSSNWNHEKNSNSSSSLSESSSGEENGDKQITKEKSGKEFETNNIIDDNNDKGDYVDAAFNKDFGNGNDLLLPPPTKKTNGINLTKEVPSKITLNPIIEVNQKNKLSYRPPLSLSSTSNKKKGYLQEMLSMSPKHLRFTDDSDEVINHIENINTTENQINEIVATTSATNAMNIRDEKQLNLTCQNIDDLPSKRVLELSSSFTPEWSIYKEATIVDYDRVNNIVTLKHHHQQKDALMKEPVIRPGKFDLQNLDDEFIIEGQQSLIDRVSTLEYGQYWADYPDLFADIAKHTEEINRAIAVLRWYVSTLYGSFRSRQDKEKFEKKPFNPILGEQFLARWEDRNDCGETVLFSEQVSHHPPVSAIYLENNKAGVSANGHSWVSGSKNSFKAQIFRNGLLKTPLFTVSGSWAGKSTIEDHNTKEKKTFFDIESQKRASPIVSLEEEQSDMESRKLWKYVAKAINEGDFSTASKLKGEIEQRQRDKVKRGEETILQYFDWVDPDEKYLSLDKLINYSSKEEKYKETGIAKARRIMTEHTEEKKATRKRKPAAATEEKKSEKAETEETSTFPKLKDFLANAKDLQVLIKNLENIEEEKETKDNETSEKNVEAKNGSESTPDEPLFTLTAKPHKHSTGSYGWTATQSKSKIKVKIGGEEVELPITITLNITVQNSKNK